MENDILIPIENMSVHCRITGPASGDIRRIVLGVHGFGGSMDDPIQQALAEEMSLFHAVTFRFDFPLDREEITLGGCMDALLAVAREARRRYPEVGDLCIFATGFGAYVTLNVLDELLELPGQVKLVVQTPSLRMHETLLSMLNISRETLWAMDRFHIPVAQPFDVTYRFFEELQSHPAPVMQHIPMLILHGEEDAFVRDDDIHLLRKFNEGAKLVTIPGASHRFHEEGAWDMVLDLTRDWFSFEQVLLTDWE